MRWKAMPSSGFTGPVRSAVLPVVLRRDADHDAGIGVALVARILAHAVGHHALRLRGGGHHGAAGTHAEAVDRAAVLRVVHQLVVGRAEDRVAGVGAEARAVDHALRMLDAEADRERLGLHEHAAPVQHLEGVARAVAEREHHVVGAQLLARGERHAADVRRLRSARRSRAAGSGSRRPAPRSRRASSRPCPPAGRCRCAAC